MLLTLYNFFKNHEKYDWRFLEDIKLKEFFFIK